MDQNDEAKPGLCWCQQGEYGHTVEHLRLGELFLSMTEEARLDMAVRLVEFARRGKGDQFQSVSDDFLKGKLDNAVIDFRNAFRHFRRGFTTGEQLRAKAADVANYAFMMVTPERLARDRG